MSKLQLHRIGSFHVADHAEDSTQCGFRRGDRTLWFDVTLEGRTEDLDGSGFLIDNNAVQHYFDQKYAETTVFVSCERIALTALADLREIVGVGRCYFGSVEIRPGDYAGIRVEDRFLCDRLMGS